MVKKLKHQFLEAVINEKIGTKTDFGLVITTKEFVNFMKKSRSSIDYLESYLSSVTIEPGRKAMMHNKYLFRVKQGVFRIHPEAVLKHKIKHLS